MFSGPEKGEISYLFWCRREVDQVLHDFEPVFECEKGFFFERGTSCDVEAAEKIL